MNKLGTLSPPSPVHSPNSLSPPSLTAPLHRLTSDVARINVLDHAVTRYSDDFDEFRARADSGGSLYGLFRRQAIADKSASGSRVTPEKRTFKRQRSRSLITRSTVPDYTDDRSVLHALFDYAEAKRFEKEPRRHTAACVDANRLSVPLRIYAPLKRQRHISPPMSPDPLSDTILLPAITTNFRIPEINVDPVIDDDPCTSVADAKPDVDHISTSRTTSANRPSRASSLTPTRGLTPPLSTPTNSSQSDLVVGVDRNSPSPDVGLLIPEIADGAPSKTVTGRRRSFAMTTKGHLVNEGDVILGKGSQDDCFKNADAISSINLEAMNNVSSTSTSGYRQRLLSAESSDTSTEGACTYSALMLGGPSVGKTALTQQFLTSEFQAAQNTSFDDNLEYIVSVLLNGEESIIGFTDVPYTGDPDGWKQYNVDAYVIVFSLTDRRSYNKAVDLLYDIRVINEKKCAIALVANKSDLVRGRLISERDGKSTAETYSCLYIEVSAALNHMVDELLVQILHIIQDTIENPQSPCQELLNHRLSGEAGCLNQAGGCVLKQLIKPPTSTCCDVVEFT